MAECLIKSRQGATELSHKHNHSIKKTQKKHKSRLEKRAIQIQNLEKKSRKSVNDKINTTRVEKLWRKIPKNQSDLSQKRDVAWKNAKDAKARTRWQLSMRHQKYKTRAKDTYPEEWWNNIWLLCSKITRIISKSYMCTVNDQYKPTKQKITAELKTIDGQ